MDEDIDLRPYIRALRQRWWWVLGLGLVAAVAVFIVSSLRPPVYEASSVMVFTTQDSTAYKTFPSLVVLQVRTGSPQVSPTLLRFGWVS